MSDEYDVLKKRENMKDGYFHELPKGGVGKKAEKDFLKEEKKKSRERKIAIQEEKMAKLTIKKQRQIETKKQKLALKQLKYETSLTGRMYKQLKETQSKIKQRQTGATPTRKTTVTPRKTIPKGVDAGAKYIVIGDQIYQRKGRVAMPKRKKEKKKEHSGWIP